MWDCTGLSFADGWSTEIEMSVGPSKGNKKLQQVSEFQICIVTE